MFWAKTMRFEGFFADVLGDWKVFLFLSFLIPAAVRALPELLMGNYPLGFDTISYYVPVTIKWVNDGVGFYEFMAYAPLFYSLLAGLTSVGVPIIVSLKILPSVLHGFLGFAIYVYARRGLDWSCRKSLFVSCLATLYFVGLRVVELPVRLKLSSRFSFRDVWRMFVDLLGIAYRLRVKNWYQRGIS